MNAVERVARAIARANGDEFANAFTSKTRWAAKRGMSGGRFRDINEPFQHDYLDMARAAIEALREPTPEMETAGDTAIALAHSGFPTPEMHTGEFKAAWEAGITAALK